WQGPAGFTDPNQNPTIIGVSAANAGVYTVTVTDVTGCTATATTTLVIGSSLVINANSNTPLCSGGTISLNASGAAVYAWTGPAGFTSLSQNPSIPGASTSQSGIYTVTGTDAGGCTNSATITVNVTATPIPQFTADQVTGCTPLCVTFTDQ